MHSDAVFSPCSGQHAQCLEPFFFSFSPRRSAASSAVICRTCSKTLNVHHSRCSLLRRVRTVRSKRFCYGHVTIQNPIPQDRKCMSFLSSGFPARKFNRHASGAKSSCEVSCSAKAACTSAAASASTTVAAGFAAPCCTSAGASSAVTPMRRAELFSASE